MWQQLIFLVFCSSAAHAFTCTGKESGFYKDMDDKDCMTYHQCDAISSTQSVFMCSEGYVYSKKVTACVMRKSEYDDCMDQFVTMEDDPRCKNLPGGSGLASDPDNCRQYIPCWEGTSQFPQKCPPTTRFSPEDQTCLHDGEVSCDARPTSGNSGTAICMTAGDRTTIRDPDNCQVYYQCPGGSYQPKNCDPQLIFSESLERCSWPNEMHASELKGCKFQAM